MKEKENLTKWMDLIMLSEVKSDREKQIPCMTFVCGN